MSTKIKVPDGWRVRDFSVTLKPGKPEGATSWFDVQGRPVVLQGSTWKLNPVLQQKQAQQKSQQNTPQEQKQVPAPDNKSQTAAQVPNADKPSPLQPSQEKKEEDPQNKVSMGDRFAQSKKTLGSGMYGTVKETAEGTVIKKGTIGANEVDIQKRLADVVGVPKILGVEYSSDVNRDGERKGIIEMEKANGKALIDQTSKSDHNIKGDEASKVLDEYFRVRKDIHTRGVAHGDMHDANMTWDGKTMGLIDFGSSVVSYKEALGEALGTRGVDHGEFFLKYLKQDGAVSAKEEKFQSNLARVSKIAQEAGDLDESKAKKLIEELYNGI